MSGKKTDIVIIDMVRLSIAHIYNTDPLYFITQLSFILMMKSTIGIIGIIFITKVSVIIARTKIIIAMAWLVTVSKDINLNKSGNNDYKK